MTDLVAIFPGQGAQSLGMCSDLATKYSVVKETFEEASDAISQDLWQLVTEGPVELLNLTENTQPALLAASISCWRVFQSLFGDNVQFTLGAGHSLGEYSALVAAGAITFGDASRLVKKRGLLMEAAVPDNRGGMAAILGLSKEDIGEVCERAHQFGVVEAANYNAPGQVVISGEQVAIEQAITIAKELGAKRAMPLTVSGPFHSSLMKAAADEFADELNKIKWNSPAFNVIHNATNQTADVNSIGTVLVQQLYSPVDWCGAIEQITEQTQTKNLIEFGPGKVLAGLVKRIDKSLSVYPTQDLGAMNALEQLIQ